jgi:nitrogen fixation protein NifZ
MVWDEVELDDSPAFEMEQKVRLRKMIRNDGTFPGREIGELLAEKGDIGYVVSIGTYLQTYYIYAVHFLERGVVVGCRKKELEIVEKE